MGKKPWGGRFSEETNPAVEKFTASIHFDARLYAEDIEGSLAHVGALKSAGIITEDDARSITNGLQKIKDEIVNSIEKGEFNPDPSFEDIHMYIESRLKEITGSVGGKLHTGRSRNDQVALDMHMYMKKEIGNIDSLIYYLQKIICDLAENNIEVIMPGYTHLQRAQPVLFSHHIMAYFWMFQRDRERLHDVFQRADIMPLGAGALAGSGFALDREKTARHLGFSRLYENSMDAVSDRDYLIEFLSCASIIMVHFSRLCEEIILWCTPEFGFIELDDAYTTGSSLMPQKKNPDIAEIIRGKTGRVYGSLMSVLTVIKGLPLCYNRDLQEDKEGLFDAIDTVKQVIFLGGEMLRTATINREKMNDAAARDGFAAATDIADYLVNLGVPFREAHHITGNMVAYCQKKNVTLKDLSPLELEEFNSSIDPGEYNKRMDPRFGIEARSIRGGTATSAVRKQIIKARNLMEQLSDGV